MLCRVRSLPGSSGEASARLRIRCGSWRLGAGSTMSRTPYGLQRILSPVRDFPEPTGGTEHGVVYENLSGRTDSLPNCVSSSAMQRRNSRTSFCNSSGTTGAIVIHHDVFELLFEAPTEIPRALQLFIYEGCFVLRAPGTSS
jgi:hypothetical protein